MHEQGYRSRGPAIAQESTARAEGKQRCRRVGDKADKRFGVCHGKEFECNLHQDNGKLSLLKTRS